MLASAALQSSPSSQPGESHVSGTAFPPQQAGQIKKLDLGASSIEQSDMALRRSQVANTQESGHSATLNSIGMTEDYLSYVLTKDNVGKVCYDMHGMRMHVTGQCSQSDRTQASCRLLLLLELLRIASATRTIISCKASARCAWDALSRADCLMHQETILPFKMSHRPVWCGCRFAS
jgi:hypothetical protein